MIKLTNEDCRQGLRALPDQSIDLIFTDPPYGIQGDKLDQHYNRNKAQVIEGYQDVAAEEYAEWCCSWIQEFPRILKPTGSLYIVSGYTNLHHILNALHKTSLFEINHLIAEYSFGVYTKNKWVSSHYHMLYWAKSKRRYFNGQARFTDTTASYNDRLSVQQLKREYKPNKLKNVNELPVNFVKKYIEYSTEPGMTVLDCFAGSGSTARACKELDSNFIGFEINSAVYNHYINDATI